jgi:hypothetical protein
LTWTVTVSCGGKSTIATATDTSGTSLTNGTNKALTSTATGSQEDVSSGKDLCGLASE